MHAGDHGEEQRDGTHGTSPAENEVEREAEKGNEAGRRRVGFGDGCSSPRKDPASHGATVPRARPLAKVLPLAVWPLSVATFNAQCALALAAVAARLSTPGDCQRGLPKFGLH